MGRQLLELRVARPAFPGLGSAWTVAVGSRELASGRRKMFARCPLRWTCKEGGELELRLAQMGPALHRADGRRAAFAEGIAGTGGHRLSGFSEAADLTFEMRWSDQRIEFVAKGIRIFDVRKAPPDPRAPKSAPTVHRASVDGADLSDNAALELLLLATPFVHHLT